MSKINLLITGGAGFIGSNLVEYFLAHKRINIVRVIDDLSNGYISNINKFFSNPRFEFIEGDIRDYDTCLKACEGIDKISHQAALGSVPRSIKNPMLTTEVNILGTINILHSAVENNIERVVLAFSSSTYGDLVDLPKVESKIGNPMSPYAVSKASIEQYANVFKLIYDLDWIGLRYFNVFGRNQNADNPYAAVIPIFCKSFLNGDSITVNGDGKTSRDFTYIDNVIQMNELALFTSNHKAKNTIYNCACGEKTSLNEIISYLCEISQKNIDVVHGPERKGDIKHSLADITKAKELLKYDPKVHFKEGLKLSYEYYKKLKNYE